MTKTLTSRLAVATAALGLALGLLGAAPSGAQTTTIPETATLTVTKAVVGTAPAGTTFTLHILCDNGAAAAADSLKAQAVVYDEDIVFGADGGSKDYTFFDSASCTVTETDDGGADSSTGPVTVDITDPTLFGATITNTFDPVATTTTEAPAAAAVQATPAFTG